MGFYQPALLKFQVTEASVYALFHHEIDFKVKPISYDYKVHRE